MLSCIYQGKPFTTKEEGFTVEDRYRLGKEKQLLCPVCKTPVHYRDIGKRIAHYAHHTVGECPIGKFRSYDNYTSINHENIVNVFIDWIKAQFPDVPVYPDYFINNEIFTDIYLELENVKIAIEIQFSNFNNPTFIKRRELYKKNNIKDIWFFIRENGEFSIGSPYERTYYRRNKRELYYYQTDKDILRAYKGFAGEQWSEEGKDTLYKAIYVEVPLEQVKIKKDGTIIIPQLKYEYLNALKDIRNKNRQFREEQRLYKEQHNQRFEEKDTYTSSYNSSNNNYHSYTDHKFYSNTSKNYNNAKSERRSKKTNYSGIPLFDRVIQDKPYSIEYEECNFKTQNGKEFLILTYLDKGNECRIEFLVIKNQGEKNDVFLECRLESESENIKYFIIKNPILDDVKKVKIQRHQLY